MTAFKINVSIGPHMSRCGATVALSVTGSSRPPGCQTESLRRLGVGLDTGPDLVTALRLTVLGYWAAVRAMGIRDLHWLVTLVQSS